MSAHLFLASLLGCGLLTSCDTLQGIDTKGQQDVRSEGIVVKLVTVYVPWGSKPDGTQFDYSPTEDERVPPNPINAEYPYYVYTGPKLGN